MTQPKNILVVDDDEVIRIACELTLKSEGLKVDLAVNGRDAREKVKQQSYDLILLDLMMPEMQGSEFLEFVHEYDENIIVIVITGFATIESAVDTLKKGAYDYLPKPFTPEELRKVVRTGLERRRLLLERQQLQIERQKNLEKIAAEQSRLRAIINCMSEGLIAADKNGKIILNNAKACQLLGIREKCKIGESLKGNLNCPELEDWICDVLNKKKFPSGPMRREIVFDREKEKTYFATLAPIRENGDEFSGLVMVLTDISEKRKFERQKADFRRLVTVVAHELKAPINAIIGYLDVVKNGFLEENIEKRNEYLDRSIEKAEKLRHLIEDLLSLTSIESGKMALEMQPVNISEIIYDVVKFFENESRIRNVKVNIDFPENLPAVSGDRNSLIYLFTNLISNAIKYNKIGGRVNISAFIEKKTLHVKIEDTGIGISEEDQKHIFQEFFRGRSAEVQKISGSGLGLSIAKKISELHQGDITVKSEIGKGSTFEVTLPIQ